MKLFYIVLLSLSVLLVSAEPPRFNNRRFNAKFLARQEAPPANGNGYNYEKPADGGYSYPKPEYGLPEPQPDNVATTQAPEEPTTTPITETNTETDTEVIEENQLEEAAADQLRRAPLKNKGKKLALFTKQNVIAAPGVVPVPIQYQQLIYYPVNTFARLQAAPFILPQGFAYGTEVVEEAW